MWVEFLCGLFFYRLFRRFFFNDDVLDVETSDSNALFSVADRLEKLYNGKAFVGLRIPDPDTGSRQNIDIVLVTKGDTVVFSVKNFAGLMSVDTDGSWVCSGASMHKLERHVNPITETRREASVLEAYLEQRGIALPEGYFSCKVVLPNPKCRTIDSSQFGPEVITYEEWVKLKPEPKSMFSGWIKGAFRGGKKEMQESMHQQLSFVLRTAPTWDRLELKGNKYVLGEFLEFKGKHEDIQALKSIRRSKVGRLIIQQTSMFGLAPSKLQVLYSPRDYRSGGASASEWVEVTVRSSTEILFQQQHSTKVRKFKLSSLVSMLLSP